VLSYIKVTNFVKLAYIGILEYFRMQYYIKSQSLLNLKILIFWKIFCVLHYIKVTKFVKLAYIGKL